VFAPHRPFSAKHYLRCGNPAVTLGFMPCSKRARHYKHNKSRVYWGMDSISVAAYYYTESPFTLDYSGSPKLQGRHRPGSFNHEPHEREKGKEESLNHGWARMNTDGN
jgi:hypothetical protein